MKSGNRTLIILLEGEEILFTIRLTRILKVNLVLYRWNILAYNSLWKEEGRIVTIFIFFSAFTFLMPSLSLFLSRSLFLSMNDRIHRWLVFLPPSFTKPNNNEQFSFSFHHWLWWKVNEISTCFFNNNPSLWLTRNHYEYLS